MSNPLTSRVGTDGFHFRIHLLDVLDAPSDVARLYTALNEYAQSIRLTRDENHALRIATEEWITNVGKFGMTGMTGGGPGFMLTVTGEVQAGDEEVRLTIADNGVAFNPAELPPVDVDADLDERHVGGLGIYLVRQLFSGHRYSRRDGWNINVWILRRESDAHMDSPA